MRAALARFALGLIAGWGLSRLRAAAGADPLEWNLPGVWSALGLRAAALLALAVLLARAQRAPPLGALFGAVAGFALHALWRGGPLGFPAWDLVAVTLLGALAAWLAGPLLPWQRGGAGEAGAPDAEEPPRAGRAPAGGLEIGGLVLAGAGTALALEGVARHLRLFGAGLAQDDSVFALSFLLMAACGAAAFGWVAARPACARLSFPLLLAAGAAAAILSIKDVEVLAVPRALDRFVREYGLDFSWQGTLGWDALLAGRLLVLPAFLIGAGLMGACGRRSLSSVLAGAALGLLAVPLLLEPSEAGALDQKGLFSAQLVTLGVLAAIAGAALALLGAPRSAGFARHAALALTLALGLLPWLVPLKTVFVLSPWQRRPVMPHLAFEAPEGLFTVEPGEAGFKVATIDRRALTPGLSRWGADDRQIEASFALLPPQVRAGRAVRVLFAGQLNATRVETLRTLGAARVDRSASWHRSMARLEAELLKTGTQEQGVVPLPGEILAPSEARARLERGDYDLLIAPEAGGESPRLRELRAPEGTLVVRWFGFDEPPRGALPVGRVLRAEGGAAFERLVVLAGAGPDEAALALVENAHLPRAGAADAPLLADCAGFEDAPAPLERLLLRKVWRADRAHAFVARRLALRHGSAAGKLLEGLALYYERQRASSPFETPAERVELDDDVLALWAASAHAGPAPRALSAFERDLWEWLARVLVGKRDVGRILRFLEPVARAHGPWPQLEVALAIADLEALDPEAAVERLAPLVAGAGASFQLRCVLADALEQSGRMGEALPLWRAAAGGFLADLDTLQSPGALDWQRVVRRRLAMALVRAGDPTGLVQVRALLREHPEDAELEAFTGSGPWPAPARGWSTPGRHEH